jgi:hypothetical protein
MEQGSLTPPPFIIFGHIVKRKSLKRERITNTKLKKDVKSVLMESSTQLGRK